jgi:hypothetical protein
MDRLEGLEKAQEAQSTLTEQLIKANRDAKSSPDGPTEEDILDNEEGTVQLPDTGASRGLPARRQKAYAVACGRETGVFDGSEWKRVTRAVSHYSGTRYKKFTGSDEVTAAWAWLERNGISREEDDLSDLDSIPTLVTQVVFKTTGPPADAPQNVNTDSRLPPDQVINVANAGPDVSIGKWTEMYGTSIQVENEVLRALCPKGITNAVRKKLWKLR